MNAALIKSITEPSPLLPRHTPATKPPLAENWSEAERTVAARKQAQAAAEAQAEAEAHGRAEAERVRFAHD